MKPDLTCELCRITGRDVRHALLRWKDAKERFGAGPRCIDVEECRLRVSQNGDDWPLEEDR